MAVIGHPPADHIRSLPLPHHNIRKGLIQVSQASSAVPRFVHFGGSLYAPLGFHNKHH